MDIRNKNNKQIKAMRENFKSLREARGWSIKELSKISGIDKKALIDIEERGDFDVQYIIDLCRIYHIKPHKIFFIVEPLRKRVRILADIFCLARARVRATD